ncbi:hypothetical protein OG948_01410 [Embleya sp. NBC_00888]|uniref:hypothetical protein n=1 Tax=Embleya sp. NBC_00888 TaxID=2975960 RepID=UPI00386381B6|nr:hypothetical protein OG948_01410 [Embleya sp. NBC_00888]
MSWGWEYEPDQASVVGGAPEAFVALVETAIAEIVRAAEVLYLDGTLYEGPNPRAATAYIDDGMFVYLIVVRSERVYVLQTTYLPAH